MGVQVSKKESDEEDALEKLKLKMKVPAASSYQSFIDSPASRFVFSSSTFNPLAQFTPVTLNDPMVSLFDNEIPTPKSNSE